MFRLATSLFRSSPSLRHQSTSSSSSPYARNYKKLIFASVFGGLTAYDLTIRDGEALGGIERFGRSFKIAFQVSLDYSIGLYGLQEDSKDYDKVRNETRSSTRSNS